jgi:hypothetical protein
VDLKEIGYEISGSTKGWEFIDCMSDYQLLKKDSASWSQFIGNVK